MEPKNEGEKTNFGKYTRTTYSSFNSSCLITYKIASVFEDLLNFRWLVLHYILYIGDSVSQAMKQNKICADSSWGDLVGKKPFLFTKSKVRR